MVGSASVGRIEGLGDRGQDLEEGSMSAAEESIQRTQMFLRQRLANRNNGNAAQDEQSARAAYGDGTKGAGGGDGENTADVADAARQAQQLAAQAYERQRAQKTGAPSGGVQYEDESSEAYAVDVAAPRLSPAKPINSVNGYRDTPQQIHGYDPASPQGVQLPFIKKR